VDVRTRFLELLATGDPIVAPGVYDGLSARVAERGGAQAVMITGAGVAASVLGTPDVGLTTMTEVVTQTRNIVRCVGIPVIGDCDTGYGGPLNVQRAVREFEDAGVAALFIEDQVSPKRCGHFEGKAVIPAAEMAAKLRAAADARRDPDLRIIARTDARQVTGLDDAVARARHYVEAGADMIFLEAPQSRAELEHVAHALRDTGVPLMVNLVEGGKTPLLPVAELAALGFRLITFSGSLQKAAIKAMRETLDALLDSGDINTVYPDRMVSLGERSDLLGLDGYMESADRYTVAAEGSSPSPSASPSASTSATMIV
jgi:2-methylisocitrate lyase-like PEP mutase family enzyme